MEADSPATAMMTRSGTPSPREFHLSMKSVITFSAIGGMSWENAPVSATIACTGEINDEEKEIKWSLPEKALGPDGGKGELVICARVINS